MEPNELNEAPRVLEGPVLGRWTRGEQLDAVRVWQNELATRGYLKTSEVDGKFGARTRDATMAFQHDEGLGEDGVVGPKTWAAARGGPTKVGKSTRYWPLCPMGARGPTDQRREELFGRFEFVREPSKTNPERIRILQQWDKQNIVAASVSPWSTTWRPRVHAAVRPQFEALWAAWGREGLTQHVLAFCGAFVPRFIRGSTTRLSNHAWGTAFDINAMWNRRGYVPALVGREGSVRELVELAYVYGFFWGGWWTGKTDGMHFEAFRIVPAEELTEIEP